MRDPSRELELLREKLENGGDAGSDEDRELLLEFDRAMRLVRSEVGEHRSLKLLRHCAKMSRENDGGLAEALEDKPAAEALVRWIHDNYDNPETNRDYRMALRMLGKRTGNSDEIPESVVWIPTGTPNDYNPSPDPSEMLEWEADVKPMIDACLNSRDKALIAVAFDAGLRGGELEALTIGQVTDGEHGLRLGVDGKMGERSVPLIPSTPYLQRWLTDHPDSEDATAPLWSKLSKPEKISYRMYLKVFEEAGERAGVTKPVTPTNFRKSNATWLARQGANAATIEDLQGRSRGSKAVARYVAKFGEQSAERAKAKLHGLEVQETGTAEEIAPVECPRCHLDTPADEDFCVHCREALTKVAREQAREDRRTLRQKVLKIAKEDPETMQEAMSAAQLLEVLEEHPDLQEDVDRFTQALEGES